MIQNATCGGSGRIISRQKIHIGGIERKRRRWSHKFSSKLQNPLPDRLISFQTLPAIKYDNIFDVYFIWQLDLSEYGI